MDPTFIHLRIHTEYSLQDGLCSIPDLLQKAHACNMPAIAITDLNNLYAAIKFYQEAMELGIKPIIGIDITVENSRKNNHHALLTLLCQNNEGYQNLLKLVSKSYLEGQNSGKPLIKEEWLATYSQGLIVLSGAEKGDIGQALLAKDIKLAKSYLKKWQTLFPQRFYIEINRTGKTNEETYIQQVLALSSLAKAPLVATNDVRFLEADDFEAHETRICIQEAHFLNDPKRPKNYSQQQYFRSQQEMQQLFADFPEALTNSVEIAKRCNVNLALGINRLPHFPVPANYTTESFLSEVAQIGLNERLAALFNISDITFETERKPYDERLQRELAVINKMGFAGYFLIVADFTKWAKKNGIPVGPGRGSGPGSLVAYALKITDLNPLTLELLFERFLNPERVSMPDFDIDFCPEGRDKVIQYVMEKHGADSVSQIITYGTMAAKAVIRDVGRVLGLGYGFVDKIAKLIPFEIGMTLEKALAQEPLLKERYEEDEEVRTLIDLGRKLEGVARNVGKHAGGIVIAPGKLTDFVPLYCEPNEARHPVTQFDKDDVEAVGLVKFDFLGLKTLTIIDRALHIINKQRKEKNSPLIDISFIPLQDAKTFQLLKQCQSTAVFQLESHGMRDLIKRLQPDCFEDLIALVALFRPGPLQSGMVDDFINRKHGRAKVSYPHPHLEPILRPTYGVILYQEQVMQIAQVLAGYTLGAADILRRAMGKKKPEEMAKQREIFCKGATSNGVNADIASHIFDLMEKFAGYGFNKSHSAAYALIAYQTAWLKAHYPAAFMSAVLSADMDRTEKILLFLEECKSLKLQVSPPDINQSNYTFTVINENHLMHGLGSIKGVGEGAIENIILARQSGGLFKNLFDFCQRIDGRKVNRRVLEALIKSGCFDLLYNNRASLMASLTIAMQQAEQSLQNKTWGQHDLLGLSTEETICHYVEASWTINQQLQGEKETLGFYLTGHPMHQYLHELQHLVTCNIGELNPNKPQSVRIAGIITSIKIRQTKRGDKMAICTIDDGTSAIEMVCFADIFSKLRALLIEEQLIIVDGDTSLDDFSNSARIICREAYSLDQAREKFAKYLKITLNNANIDAHQLGAIFTAYQGGTCPIIIKYLHGNISAHIQLGKKWHIKPTDLLLNDVKNKLSTQVELVYVS